MTLDEIYSNHLFVDELKLPPVRLLNQTPSSSSDAPLDLAMTIKPAKGQVHSKMRKETDFWTYDGCVPGPTLSVKTDQRVRVTFDNQLADAKGEPAVIPFESFVVKHDPDRKPVLPHPMLYTGNETGDKNMKLDTLTGWTVTHLHGGSTQADSDGWTDNVAGLGERVEKVYQFPVEEYQFTDNSKEKDKVTKFDGGVAPTLWYHDHAMGVTRFNVYAGLAGMCLVRDELEERLSLPVGDCELPLVVQDRNFETEGGARDGELTGKLLHKVQSDVMECFCPATLVNGQLWPKATVKAKVHRLRIVNGSNARFFRFHFVGVSTKDQTLVHLCPNHVVQIGTDGGLLPCAVTLPEIFPKDAPAGPGYPCLTMAPGERADVLVDFAAIKELDNCSQVVVYNSAPAPYGAGSDLETAGDIFKHDEKNLRRYPEVMRFDIDGAAECSTLLKDLRNELLGDKFHRLDHDELKANGHDHVVVALREEPQPDGSTMLFLHEMMKVEGTEDNEVIAQRAQTIPVPDGLELVIPEKQSNGCWKDVTYVTVAKRFNDRTTVTIEKDSWCVWKIINLSPDTHPFHIHMVQFQALNRTILTPVMPPSPDPNILASIPNTRAYIKFEQQTEDRPLDANEIGWKDTIRVNPGEREDVTDNFQKIEMMTVAAQFKAHAGRYMYHCHILEHEDYEMMRPFIVAPKALMNFMGSGMSMKM